MKTNLTASRRTLLKGGALGSTCIALSATSALAEEAPASPDFDEQTDVLVLGGGAGGCFSANFAKQQGAEVILVEASSLLGGTALLSGGFFHTWDITADNVDQMLPSSDPHRRQLFVEKWREVCDWALSQPDLGATPLDLDYPLYGAHLIGFAIGGADKAAGRNQFFNNLVDDIPVKLLAR